MRDVRYPAASPARPGKLPWRYDEEDPRCAALKKRIFDAAEAAYQEGFRHFLCGMALGCDLYFCESVLRLRRMHPDVTVEAAIPCPTQADAWPPDQRRRYARLVAACDYETLVSQQYSPACMQRRDRYMVDHASLLIAAFDGSPAAPGTRWSMPCAGGGDRGPAHPAGECPLGRDGVCASSRPLFQNPPRTVAPEQEIWYVEEGKTAQTADRP